MWLALSSNKEQWTSKNNVSRQLHEHKATGLWWEKNEEGQNAVNSTEKGFCFATGTY